MGRKIIISRRFLPNHIEYPPVPIIEHADVKRMLHFQPEVVKGSLSLLLQCSYYVDM